MSNLMFNVANDKAVQPNDVSEWLDGIVRDIKRVGVLSERAKSAEDDIYILNKIDELSVDLRSTEKALEMVDLSYLEMNADLESMGLNKIVKGGGFNYKNDSLYFNQLAKNISEFADTINDTVDSGERVDYSILNDVLNNENLKEETNFTNINDNSYKEKISRDFRVINENREIIKSKAYKKGFLPSDFSSIAEAPLHVNKINRDDIEKEDWEKMGYRPVKKPIFDTEELYTLDIKSGVSKVKALLKKDIRISLNIDAVKELAGNIGDSVLRYNGRPWAMAWDSIAELAGKIDWTFGFGGDRSVNAVFVDAKPVQPGGDRKNYYTLLKKGELTKADDDGLSHIRDLSVVQYERMREEKFKEMVDKIERGQKINNTYFNEKDKAERVVEGLLERGSNKGFLGVRDQKLLELNERFLVKLNEMEEKHPYISYDLQPKEVEMMKVEALSDNIKSRAVNPYASDLNFIKSLELDMEKEQFDAFEHQIRTYGKDIAEKMEKPSSPKRSILKPFG